MLDHATPPEVLFGAAYQGHSPLANSASGLTVDGLMQDGRKIKVECEALVGADGVGSKVRSDIGASLHGQKSKCICIARRLLRCYPEKLLNLLFLCHFPVDL